MICPKCKEKTVFHHDKWEDMYRCTKCDLFWEPEELNIKPDHGNEYLKGLSN